jgi:hypothetical protein
MITATKDFLSELDAIAEKRKSEISNTLDELEIKGTTYYVSASGDDENNGLSPETAWKTLERVSNAEIKEGDGVLFRRGDTFRGFIITKPGVSYGAYGKGEKPRLYGWNEDLALPELWEEFDKENHIWKYTKKILDCGTLVFNSGEKHSLKHIPSYINGRFVCREDESKQFVMTEQMTGDLDIYWHFEDKMTISPSKGQDFPIPDVVGTYGDLYLRCDAGNPGEIFKSIEALPRRNMFNVKGNKNVRIDNLCLKYIGCHAISAGGPCVEGLKVTSCEIGWVGGCIQHYLGTDPNYPQGGRGTVTRYGNGVEIYGGCDDYEVSNCYIYQMYDAGITHQVSTFGRTYQMKNVRYLNNLVEYCVYSIEYFLEINGGSENCFMDNIEMSGNILRYSGYGWGQQRHNKHTPAHIKGWSYTNTARNYAVHDNIFDRAAYKMVHLVAEKAESLPRMYNNTYVQYAGNDLGQYGANEVKEPPILIFDNNIKETIDKVLCDENAKVYMIK